MPRDSNGNYTLPSGNPVVSGEVISTSWANPTLSDVAAEMTNSLDRSGRGGMLAPFKFLDGTAAAPGMSWTSEPTSGFYRAGLSDMRATVAGIGRMRWTGVGCDVWDTAANAGAGAWFSLSGAAGLNIPLLNNANVFAANGNSFPNLKIGTGAAGISATLGIINPAGTPTAIQLFQEGVESWTLGMDASSAALVLKYSSTLCATFNNAGLTMAAGMGVVLTNAGNTAFRALKIGASDEFVVNYRGGLLHWSSPSLGIGEVFIATTAPATSGGRPGVMTLVYE